MGRKSEAGSVRIGIAAGPLLAQPPEAPTVLGCLESGAAQGINVTKVAGSAALDESHHLAGCQVVQTVKAHIGPGEGRGRLELGGALSDLKAEDSRRLERPPGIDVVSGPIVQVVQEAKGPAHR